MLCLFCCCFQSLCVIVKSLILSCSTYSSSLPSLQPKPQLRLFAVTVDFMSALFQSLMSVFVFVLSFCRFVFHFAAFSNPRVPDVEITRIYFSYACHVQYMAFVCFCPWTVIAIRSIVATSLTKCWLVLANVQKCLISLLTQWSNTILKKRKK